MFSFRRLLQAFKEARKPRCQGGYYASEENPSYDIWSQVQDEVKDRIPKGYTVYGEIVGWTAGGKMIQKGYHYGCSQGEHRLLVYRVTTTNADGKVSELAWKPMLEFCAKYGFEPVLELFYGRACDFVITYHPSDNIGMSTDSNGVVTFDAPAGKEFGELFIEALEHQYLEKMCKHNRNEVPSEGVVIRIDHLEECESYKLKSAAFLRAESAALDAGSEDLEAEEEAASLETTDEA